MSLDGLRDLDDEPAASSSGSSGNSSGYPKTQQRVPHLVIYTDRDGEYKAARQPQDRDLTLTYLKEDKNSSYELHSVPEYIERYWMDVTEFRFAEKIVQEVLEEELSELVNNDPRAALRAVKKSAKVYQTDREVSRTEKCPVCRTDLSVLHDDYDVVNDRRVCSDHTVTEIKESGLLDRSGIPRNRLWE